MLFIELFHLINLITGIIFRVELKDKNKKNKNVQVGVILRVPYDGKTQKNLKTSRLLMPERVTRGALFNYHLIRL